MTTENWVDLFKWVAAFAGTLAAIYGIASKWFDIVRSRPPALEDKASKLIAASLERDSHNRLEYMEQISRVLEKLASIQLGMAEGGVRAQSNTETLHKLTRDRIDSLSHHVVQNLGEVKENQVKINTTIEKFGNAMMDGKFA